ncbi:hypothetical protein AK812_SmicGene42416 [Symbiodinium microadriaticum]|uniref:Uncharacterized protein n=1 Tax=Symbiodinium microadriaticum TaxID=2951 RepID=A0A1Q9C3M5_SYMMI|nr:hypothetical protein AK812_SmicGene42416 [Symbiodinium microadriaticum]
MLGVLGCKVCGLWSFACRSGRAGRKQTLQDDCLTWRVSGPQDVVAARAADGPPISSIQSTAMAVTCGVA